MVVLFAGLVVTPSAFADEFVARTHSVLAPPHILWRVTAGLRAPGMAGIDAAVDLTLPFAPVYLGVRASQAWGPTSGQFNGPQWEGATTGEARLGFTAAEGWSLRSAHLDIETRQAGAVTLSSDRYADPTVGYRYTTVNFETPEFYRWTVFASAIRRWQTAQGTDTGEPFASVGVSWLRRHSAVAAVDGFGNFETERTETWTLQATYCLVGDPSLGTPRRLGGVLEYVWQSSVLAVSASAGWDGQLVLASVGIGLGGAHSLGGPVPQTPDLR